MKKIFALALILACAFCMSADAKPLAQEIAFSQCQHGVPVFDDASGKTHCGVPGKGGAGYILHVAVPSNQPATCPEGFRYLAPDAASGKGGMQIFSCVKS
jgi:hypothetical protein